MLSKEDVRDVIEITEDLCRSFTPVSGACLYMSSFLAGCISDHLSLSPQVCVGSLNVEGKTIFSHSPIKEKLSIPNGVSISDWDGHCWVTLNDELICDPSVFLTVYGSNSPPAIRLLFQKRFGAHCNYLIGQPHKLEEIGVVYKPKEILCTSSVDLIIGNIERLGLLNS